MRLAIAQIKSSPGDIAYNISKHLKAVDLAVINGAKLIGFPELSVTGYEPTLAEALAFDISDQRLRVFETKSIELGISIGVGLPTKSKSKPRISQLFFNPDGKRTLYSKQTLHDDEKAFFKEGEELVSMVIGLTTVVPAICYESLTPEHLDQAMQLAATVYLACVAKPQEGVAFAHSYFPEVAKKFGLLVIMGNAVGPSDDFLSSGQSAAWDEQGNLLAMLDDSQEALLIIDLDESGASCQKINMP
jgi:predicted amidohydrolase